MDNIINNLSNTLSQGLHFQQKQNLTTKKTVHVHKHKHKHIEGFNKDLNNEFSQDSSLDTAERNKLLIAQQNSNDAQELYKLTTEYNSILKLYNTAQDGITKTTTDYLNNKSTPNPYAGKSVKLNGDNTFGYVTKSGVYKWYDPTIISNTAGKNRCPPLDPKDASTYTPINITTDNYNIPGGIISTTPPLTVGNPMKLGQSCGKEGKNVIVSDGGPAEGETKYVGCYKNNDNMIKQPEGAIFNSWTCGQRAFNKSSQYFAMNNYQSSSGFADCYISNDVKVTKTGDGNVYTPNTLWDTKLSKSSGATMTLNNDGNIYIYDYNGTKLLNTKTGPPECNIIPTNIVASWGANVDIVESFGRFTPPKPRPAPPPNLTTARESFNVETSSPNVTTPSSNVTAPSPNVTTQSNVGNLTEYLNSLNNDETSFSFKIPNNFTDPAPGKYKTLNLSYKCGDKIKVYSKENATKADTFVLDCSSALTTCICYLILEDNGNVSIYGGESPDKKTTKIYSWPAYDVSNSIPNPAYAVSKGKTGNNWIGSGGVLSSGEWISSNDGLMVLIMQSTGNLALITFTLDTNKSCTRQGNINYGGEGSNAIYQFLIPPNNSKIGLVGYINDDAELQQYPSNMIGYEENSIMQKAQSNIPGRNLPNMPIKNSTSESCRTASINNVNSGGCAFNNITKECWIKDNTVNTATLTTPAQNIDLYIKPPGIINSSPSCNSSILGRVTSELWSAYTKGSDISSDDTCGLASATTDQQANLKTLRERLQSVASKIVEKMNALENENIKINTNMINSNKQYSKNLGDYNDTAAKISKINTNQKKDNTVNSMVNDSDLVVLQENYTYLFWSILAAGILTVTLRNLNK